MKNQKGFSVTILLVIAIIIIVLIGGGLGYYYIFLAQPNQQNQSSTNNQNNQAVADATANWSSFTNSKNEFSFKYPDGWQVEEREAGHVGIFYSATGRTPAEVMSLPESEVSDWIYVLINTINKEEISKTKGLNTLDSYTDWTIKDFLDQWSVLSKRENIMVGNKAGIRLEFIFNEKSIKHKHYIEITESGDNWYQFNYDIFNSELMDSFDKIITTFVFK